MHRNGFDRLPAHLQKQVTDAAKKHGMTKEAALHQAVTAKIAECGLERALADLHKELEKVPRLGVIQGGAGKESGEGS